MMSELGVVMSIGERSVVSVLVFIDSVTSSMGRGVTSSTLVEGSVTSPIKALLGPLAALVCTKEEALVGSSFGAGLRSSVREAGAAAGSGAAPALSLWGALARV